MTHNIERVAERVRSTIEGIVKLDAERAYPLYIFTLYTYRYLTLEHVTVSDPRIPTTI